MLLWMFHKLSMLAIYFKSVYLLNSKQWKWYLTISRRYSTMDEWKSIRVYHIPLLGNDFSSSSLNERKREKLLSILIVWLERNYCWLTDVLGHVISFTIHSSFVILSQTLSSKLKTRTISFCFSVHKIVEKCWFKDQILVATKNEKIMKNKGSLADKRRKRLLKNYKTKVVALSVPYMSYFVNISSNVNGKGSKITNLAINAFSCYVGLDRC